MEQPIQGIQISDTLRDRLIISNKALWGQIPLIGPIIAELLGTTIPMQRADRMSAVLHIFDQKIQRLELGIEHLANLMSAETFVDILEDAMFQATRAMSDERREYIASFLVTSLTSDDLDHLQEKRVLALLERLNDIEIIMLNSYNQDPSTIQDYYRQHEHVLKSPRLLLDRTDQATINKAAVYGSYRRNLLDLGLIKENFKKPKKGESPEFDFDTGRLATRNPTITTLGRLLLHYIGV